MQYFMGKADKREAANDEVVTGEMTKEGKSICQGNMADISR